MNAGNEGAHMNSTPDTSQPDEHRQIDNALAAVEGKIARLHAKLHKLEARRDRLRTAQSVVLELLGENSDQGIRRKPEPDVDVGGRAQSC